MGERPGSEQGGSGPWAGRTPGRGRERGRAEGGRSLEPAGSASASASTSIVRDPGSRSAQPRPPAKATPIPAEASPCLDGRPGLKEEDWGRMRKREAKETGQGGRRWGRKRRGERDGGEADPAAELSGGGGGDVQSPVQGPHGDAEGWGVEGRETQRTGEKEREGRSQGERGREEAEKTEERDWEIDETGRERKRDEKEGRRQGERGKRQRRQKKKGREERGRGGRERGR